MRLLLDTNLPIDVLQDRPGLADESLAVIERAAELGAEMFIAWHGLATAYYLLRRGRPETTALADVDQILTWAQVASVGDADARRARTFACSDFEDALQIASAEACGADLIITRNTADFKASSVPAITPVDFLARFPATPAVG